MKLHPRIKHLFSLVEEYQPKEILGSETLHFLKSNGATATEASILFHLAYNIPLEKAEKTVYNSRIFPEEEINDTAYQTLSYMYYDED